MAGMSGLLLLDTFYGSAQFETRNIRSIIMDQNKRCRK